MQQQQQQLEWWRAKILELMSKGETNQSEIARILQASTLSQTDDSVKSDKIKALALAKECYEMKLELLTNSTVVDDAIRFVAPHWYCL